MRLTLLSYFLLCFFSYGVYAMSWFKDDNLTVEYGTKEFKQWLSDKKVTPKQAWEIHMSLLRQRSLTYPYKLWICVGDEYFFSTSDINKLRKVELSGIYINAYTGKARFSDDKGFYTLKEIYATPTFVYKPSDINMK
jgi:alpha-galactosidase/6-phospho-beta-glucosidase family protein